MEDGWESESAGDASGAVIAFDACVSATLGHMKRRPGLARITASRVILARDGGSLKGALGR